MKVKLYLTNCATRADSRHTAGTDISKFVKKVNLASLKSGIDELDIDKLETIPVDLSCKKN